jgi:hypothetical protein
MKSFSFRVPDWLADEIEAEARARGITKSDVVRERLHSSAPRPNSDADPLASIRDLVGSTDRGPTDLSARKKHYLRAWGLGRNRPP